MMVSISGSSALGSKELKIYVSKLKNTNPHFSNVQYTGLDIYKNPSYKQVTFPYQLCLSDFSTAFVLSSLILFRSPVRTVKAFLTVGAANTMNFLQK